jgi:23S rRNA U2552 (ribose-2'-O)-methylase RlmE/FtsJ
MKTIVEFAEKYNTDKKMNNGKQSINGLSGHDYAAIYDKYLSHRQIKTMLEIGIAKGASLKMWNEYFDYKCQIHAIDIDDKMKFLDRNNLHIHIGDQKDIEFLEKDFRDIEFDFIVDDGSHRMIDQQISFKILWDKLKSGGLYVIEDLHTSLIPSFYSSNPETTTLQLLEHLKYNGIMENIYISLWEQLNILPEINDIEIFKGKKYIIGFIKKK